MWQRIRVVLATVFVIIFLSVAVAQAVHAWRRTKEGAVGGSGASASGDGAGTQDGGVPCNPTKCAPGDLSCQVQQQAETIARLQAAMAALTKLVKEVQSKADAAAASAQKVGKATLSAHNARDAQATAAAAPLANVGASALPVTPIPHSTGTGTAAGSGGASGSS